VEIVASIVFGNIFVGIVIAKASFLHSGVFSGCILAIYDITGSITD